MEESSTARRARSQRAIELDAVLERVAIEQIVELGWDAMSARKVATAAGVTIGAFYSRYLTMPDLGRHLFEELLAERFYGALGAVVEAATDPTDLVLALAPFAAGEPHLVAALELVFAGQFDEQLRRTVLAPVGEVLGAWVAPSERGAIKATVAASALGIALGLLVRSARPWCASGDIDAELERHALAFASPADPVELEPTAATSPLRVTHFADVDAPTARLLLAMVETVGSMGYRRATVAAVCASVGVSTGFLFVRYPTKQAMLEAAIEATWSQSCIQSQERVVDLMAQFPPAVVEALEWREVMHPDLGDMRRFLLEIERLARVDERLMARIAAREGAILEAVVGSADLAAAPGNVLVGLALGIGLPVLAVIVPDAWTLPFSAVTAPLTATDPLAAGGAWAARAATADDSA